VRPTVFLSRPHDPTRQRIWTNRITLFTRTDRSRPFLQVKFAGALTRAYKDFVLFPHTLPWPGLDRSVAIAGGAAAERDREWGGGEARADASSRASLDGATRSAFATPRASENENENETAAAADDGGGDGDGDGGEDDEFGGVPITDSDDDDVDVEETDPRAAAAAARNAARRRRGIDGGSAAAVRSIHWSPYDRVRVVNADP